MSVTQEMLARGLAAGIEPREDETARAFANRVRRAEKKEKPAPAGGRRSIHLIK